MSLKITNLITAASLWVQWVNIHLPLLCSKLFVDLVACHFWPAVVQTPHDCMTFIHTGGKLLETSLHCHSILKRMDMKLHPLAKYFTQVFFFPCDTYPLLMESEVGIYSMFFYIKKSIFWYQKIIFWYQKFIFDIKKEKHFLISENHFLISENHFLISENHFLISENIFWYKKTIIFWYQKIIFWYQKIIFWYKKIQNKFPFVRYFRVPIYSARVWGKYIMLPWFHVLAQGLPGKWPPPRWWSLWSIRLALWKSC